MTRTIRTTARLRSRNQLTLPAPVVDAIGIGEGDAFAVEHDPSEPDVVVLRRIRASYAGALRSLYAPTDEYLEGERAGWD